MQLLYRFGELSLVCMISNATFKQLYELKMHTCICNCLLPTKLDGLMNDYKSPIAQWDQSLVRIIWFNTSLWFHTVKVEKV